MKQIAVTKIIRTPQGEVTRNMMLDESVWEKIVSGDAKEANTTWKLREVAPVVTKETELLKKEMKEVNLTAKVDAPKEIKKEAVKEEAKEKPKQTVNPNRNGKGTTRR